MVTSRCPGTSEGSVLNVDVDVVDLRAQADASLCPHLTITLITQYTLISNYDVNCDFRFRGVLLGNHKSYLDVAKLLKTKSFDVLLMLFSSTHRNLCMVNWTYGLVL